MAITLNDNLKINAGKPIDTRYLNGIVPYTGTSEVNSVIPISERYNGLTVKVNNEEYWYFTGVTNSDLVLKTVTGSGGSGERIEKEFTQASHGFSVGSVVSNSGGTFVLGIADGTQDAETFGIVTEVADVNTFTVVFAGYIEGFNPAGAGYSISAGNTYWLSPVDAGELIGTPPTTEGTIDKPMFYAVTATEGLVFQYRGISVFTGATGGGGAVSGVTDGFNIGNGVDVFQQVVGDTMFFHTIAGTGNTFAFIDNDTIYIGTSGATASINVGGGEGEIFKTATGGTNEFRTLVAGTGITITTTGDTVVITQSGTTNVIGEARDGTYLDGLFPFTTSTPTGFAIDDINEFLALLAPEPAPALDDISGSGTFFNGKLSFGTTNSIVGYTNVSAAAGNSAVDINGTYSGSGTRLGITKLGVTGVLNSDVVGDVSGIPYFDTAFSQGTTGQLELELNGSLVNILDLTSTTGATNSTSANTTINVTAIDYVKFDNGNDFLGSPYRTGTYTINTTAMVNGFNYIRISHAGTGNVTNYLEWVYDPEGSNITLLSPQLVNLSLTGSRFVSGVEYNEGGSVDYDVVAESVYKNVFSNSSTAVSFPSRTNLAATPAAISITGSGVNVGSSQSLPDLNPIPVDPNLTDIRVISTMSINNNIVLGSIGSTGTIGSNISIDHPFPDEAVTGGAVSDTGFLIYNINQSVNDENEDFTGEVRRLEARDYTGISYGTINSGANFWDNTQDLLLGNAQHSTGLLVFNGELVYPSSSYLTTQYGITNGDFSAVANGPAGNPDYSTAVSTRDHYRFFKSNNTTTQSTITIEITHTGTNGDFLTNGGTGGSPSGNNIKLEFVIKRSGGQTHGWANPFASSGNPEGISNLTSTHGGGVTTVSATLATTPRIGNGDLVIVRIFAASGYTNRISNLEITNI